MNINVHFEMSRISWYLKQFSGDHELRISLKVESNFLQHGIIQKIGIRVGLEVDSPKTATIQNALNG